MKALKIMILFIIVLSGCSKKYLDSREEEFLGREVLKSWKDLRTEIIAQSDESFSLNFQINDLIEVRDSLKLKEVYMRGYERGDGRIEQNFFLGFFEVIGGCAIVGSCCLAGCAASYDSPRGELPVWVVGLVPVGIAGFSLMMDGLPQYVRSIKVIPAHVRLDTLCVDRVLLSDEKVKIMLENTNFEKLYHTDEDGNVELKISEIIPEPTESDSILNIIIRYEEMVDSVEVKLRW